MINHLKTENHINVKEKILLIYTVRNDDNEKVFLLSLRL